MLTDFKNHIANLSLRAVTIIFRFLLVFGLGKFYSTADLGTYGLFSTTVTIVLFFLGFDFYAYAHRELLRVSKIEQVELLGNTLVFFFIVYLLVLPLCLFVFLFDVVPARLILWFYIILVLEHLSQELYRLYILFKKQFFANILLFLRMAAWILPVAIYWVLKDYKNLSLDVIWYSWTIGSATSVVVGTAAIFTHYADCKGKFTLRWGWIKKGIPISGQFLIGTIAYKLIEFSDRYFLNFYMDKHAVGIYTFYYNFANVLQTMVFTIVIAELYPKLAEYHIKKDSIRFEQHSRLFKSKVLKTSIASGIVMALVIFPVIHVTGKFEFYDNILTYNLLIVAVTLLNISFIPHYILYAMNKDTTIMVATLCGAFLNIVGNVTLTKYFGLVGSAASTIASYLSILIIKVYFMRKQNEA